MALSKITCRDRFDDRHVPNYIVLSRHNFRKINTVNITLLQSPETLNSI